MVDSRRVTVARARPRASSSRAKDSMSARRTANKARDRVRHQVVNWRRSSVYASRVRPRYPARNPARATRSASVKTGWIVASAADGAVVIGHLPARLAPGSWASPGPSDFTETHRKPPGQATLCRPRTAARSDRPPAKSSISNLASGTDDAISAVNVADNSFWRTSRQCAVVYLADCPTHSLTVRFGVRALRRLASRSSRQPEVWSMGTG